ncbi:MAG: 2Fe-2S iron-sulfur cluster-binding protein [Pseudomonadota bacterium]
MKIYCTGPDGQCHVLDAIEGWTIMEILRDAGMPLKAECGGACACATCHVYVAPEWRDRLAPARDEEDDMLADAAIAVQPNSRLSCQLIMRADLDGIAVTLAPMP